MHIFIMGLNIDEDRFIKISAQTNRIKSVYPSLTESSKFIYHSAQKRNFIISHYRILPDDSERNYIHETADMITFFSGLPIDPEDKIKAHDAKCISDDFPRIKNCFEGQAALLRLNKLTGTTEIISDILGMEQIYYSKSGDSMLVSNSISLLSACTSVHQFDHQGLSYFLALGWAASNHTLLNKINVIKGGEYWLWKDRQLYSGAYFQLPLSASGKGKVNRKIGNELTSRMQNRISIISRYFDIECPLTGGFDSRVLAALLMNLNVKADFYTSGNPDSDDVKIARQIASMYQFRHRVFQIEDNFVVEHWDTLVKNFIAQNDGMISLWQLADIIANSEKKPSRTVRLTAHGATIAKVIYDIINIQNKTLTPDALIKYFTERLISNSGGFLTDLATDTAKKYLLNYITERLQRGVSPAMIPNHYFVEERIGRFHGNSWNKTRELSDSYDIFCSPFYLHSALNLATYQKTTYPFHYMIFKQLDKRLIELPFSDNRKFSIQNPDLYLLILNSKEKIKKVLKNVRQSTNLNLQNKIVRKTAAFNQALWFQMKIKDFQSVILDQGSSELWHYIKKDAIEAILCNPEISVRTIDLHKIYLIATLFYYNQYLRQSAISNNQGISLQQV